MHFRVRAGAGARKTPESATVRPPRTVEQSRYPAGEALKGKTLMAETLEPRVREDTPELHPRRRPYQTKLRKGRALLRLLQVSLFPGTLAITEYSSWIAGPSVSAVIQDRRGDAPTPTTATPSSSSRSRCPPRSKRPERQLQEYVAGTWQKDKATHSLIWTIASDGINWKIH